MTGIDTPVPVPFLYVVTLKKKNAQNMQTVKPQDTRLIVFTDARFP